MSNARRIIYTFEIIASSFLHGRDAENLSSFLLKERGSNLFTLRAVPRERHWAITLPLGAFAGRFNQPALLGSNTAPAEVVTPAHEAQAFHDVYAAAQKAKARIQDPLVNRNWMSVHEGMRFFRQEALDYLAFHAPHPPLFHALSAFLTHVERRETKIDERGKHRHIYPNRKIIIGTGRRYGKKPLLAPEERTGRGPAWSNDDDNVLRRFFAPDASGVRFEMTEAWWTRLLKEFLRGERSRSAVTARITILNAKLKKSLMVDGLLPQSAIDVYASKCLGQRVHLPILRPRLDGTYGGFKYDSKHHKLLREKKQERRKKRKAALAKAPAPTTQASIDTTYENEGVQE